MSLKRGIWSNLLIWSSMAATDWGSHNLQSTVPDDWDMVLKSYGSGSSSSVNMVWRMTLVLYLRKSQAFLNFWWSTVNFLRWRSARQIALISSVIRTSPFLRATAYKHEESSDRTKILDFFLFHLKHPFDELLSKIILKSSIAVLLLRKIQKLKIRGGRPLDPPENDENLCNFKWLVHKNGKEPGFAALLGK